MNSKQTLEILLVQLSNVTGKAHSKDDAISKGLSSYLYLDNYPMYGGYNLVSVSVVGGGHSDSFMCFPSCGGRIPAKQMVDKIRTFMCGINYKTSL